MYMIFLYIIFANIFFPFSFYVNSPAQFMSSPSKKESKKWISSHAHYWIYLPLAPEWTNFTLNSTTTLEGIEVLSAHPSATSPKLIEFVLCSCTWILEKKHVFHIILSIHPLVASQTLVHEVVQGSTSTHTHTVVEVLLEYFFLYFKFLPEKTRKCFFSLALVSSGATPWSSLDIA